MNILAIDPGLTFMGWAVLKDDGMIEVVKTGMVLSSKHVSRVKYRDSVDNYGKRTVSLDFMMNAITELIRENSIDILAIEGSFYNARTPSVYGSMMQILGVIMLTTYKEFKLRVWVVPTKIAKKWIAGDGGSSKMSVKDAIMYKDDINIPDDIELTEHILDAIAVGYALIKNDYKIPDKKKKKKRKK